MGHMAFGAELAGIMFLGSNLMQPFRPRWTGFVAAHTKPETELGQLYLGILHMFPRRPVAGFTGKGFVFGLGELLRMVGMALGAGGFARPERFARRDLLERGRAIV